MSVARRKEQRSRAAKAVAASVLFHIAVFVLVFARATGSLVSAGDAGGGLSGPVFAVSLVRLGDLTSDAPTQTAARTRRYPATRAPPQGSDDPTRRSEGRSRSTDEKADCEAAGAVTACVQ